MPIKSLTLYFLIENTMKIAIFQNDIVWGNPAANREHVAEILAGCERADLLVLPEMFSTGFCTEPQGVAEPADNLTLHCMKEWAAQYDCAVAGSVAVEENGRYYNHFYFVKPDGETSCYDKHHLFTFGGEDKRFTPGDRRVVVEFRGVRILLQICYDLRFPVFSRNRNDYDLALYVASWPSPRAEAWTALLRARAIENQCFVAGVNRVGNDPSCSYSGHSVVLDAYGRTLAACTPGVECVAYAEIDMNNLLRFRQKFPVLGDGDDFVLK